MKQRPRSHSVPPSIENGTHPDSPDLWRDRSTHSVGMTQEGTAVRDTPPARSPVPVPGRSELERELLHLHAASFGWALSCCEWNQTEAEEVLQSAYLRALDGRARFDGRASCRTWFFGVVRVTAAERRRSRWIRGKAFGGWLLRRPEDESPTTPESASSNSESLEHVRRALRRLSPRQRGVLHLVFYQDSTIEEAAEVLGIRVGTARKYYERAKARLRQLLVEDPQ